MLLRFCLLAALTLVPGAAGAAAWETAFAQMPLPSGTRHLNRTNCVEIMLAAFRANPAVKGLIFMPGATDEFYMFRRAQARLTNASPTLLDAVTALTNQTLIRATCFPPFLLLHTDEDPLEPLITVEHAPTAERLKKALFLPAVLYNDRDWDVLQPILKKTLKVDIRPWRWSYDSWHFYRHSFVARDLTGWEALEAAALAGKSRFTVRRKQVDFQGDVRVRATPP